MKIPLYFKLTILLVGLCALIALLYVAQSIIVPLIFAVIIAIILHPVVNFISRSKINRVLAILLAMFLAFILIAGIGILIYAQASSFSDSWPIVVNASTDALNQAISWVSSYFHINPKLLDTWIAKIKDGLINHSGFSIGQTLFSLGSGLMNVIILPVYIFIILYYKPLIMEFIHRLFGKSNQARVSEIITQIKTVIQRYLYGLVIEFIIMAILNSVALLILGVDYAILLGIIGALLNLIPYIGGVVGVALPMMVALATKPSPWTAVYVLIVYYIIQLIDNNLIVPKIVASKVKINALFSIIAVLVGYSIWGISGMFLSIPLLAIIKLICDHVEPLKPWGFLLGITMPRLIKRIPFIKRRSKSHA